MTNDIDKQKLRKLAAKIHEDSYKIEVEVLEGGAIPFKKNKTDAGFDLIATEDVTLYPGDVQRHPLNIRLKLPRGTWARIETKSGLGAKGQLVYAGVIDEEYRGIPHVIMTNVNRQNTPTTLDSLSQQTYGPAGKRLQTFEGVNTPIIIKKGEKLAQMTMNPHSTEYYVKQVESVEVNTSRGEGGFGSTGA